MKNLIIVIFLAIITSSCLTPKRIQKNCHLFAQMCTVDKQVVIKYRDTTIYVDRLIEVPVPHFKDSVRIRDSVRIVTVVNLLTNEETHQAQMDTTTKHFGIIGVQAWVNDSKVGVDAWLTDSTFLYNFQDSIKIDNAIKDKETTNTIQVKYIPKFYKFLLWLFIIQILIVVIWAVLKFNILNQIKGYIKKR